MKDSVKKMREEATEWEKKLAKDISGKGPLSKIRKKLLKFKNQKINT